ncbi:MAG TPA: cyclic nucleotide-binding domain-containing protein [bacterium]|nr:cyclic nucleotide-binding domain-containing protein [bacterium]
MKTKLHLFSNLRGDIFGGLSSSIIALPLALAFGIVAFAPLGPEFASQGALACLYGAILTSFFASLFGGTPTQITGPTGPMSVMIAAMLTSQLQARSISTVTPGSEMNTIFTMVFFAVFLGGVVQVLLGLSGGGKLIKYIPYPVIAGFMNGVAMIIFLSQLKPFLGLTSSQAVIDVFTGAITPSWVSMAVGAVTIIAVIFGPKLIRGVPGALMGLIAGLLCFFIIGAIFRSDLLVVEGNRFIIGNIPTDIPRPVMAANFIGFFSEMDASVWMAVLIPAITLGMLGSIDSLLTSLVADVITKTRHNSRQELFGQGIGNMISSLFAGLPGAGSTVRTLANVQNGGRTRLSGMICGLAVFLVLILFGKYARFIPYSVLAGILMVTSSRMFDTWSFKLIKQKSTWRGMVIVVLVAGVTVLVSLIVAVGIGVLITMILFIRDQVARSVIKNKFFGNQVHSKKIRTTEEMLHLQTVGDRIVLYKLDGSLFFGTSDGLMQEVEKQSGNCDVVILDFRLVKEIDLTGAQILRQVNDQLCGANKHLLLSYVSKTTDYDLDRVSAFLTEIKILDQIGEEKLFHDTDLALEWAENYVLHHDGLAAATHERCIDIHKMDIFKYLNNDEINDISRILTHNDFSANDVIFQEGDQGDTMYLVSRGCVSIFFEVQKGKRLRRIASFGEGTFFGEMALLEQKPRSASAIADRDTELYTMTRHDFMELIEKSPNIATKVQLGIACELSSRLRSTSEELRALEI